ncbi:MAG: helix-turn-helix transcriptional regulator [Flavobacteriales bacterium]
MKKLVFIIWFFISLISYCSNRQSIMIDSIQSVYSADTNMISRINFLIEKQKLSETLNYDSASYYSNYYLSTLFFNLSMYKESYMYANKASRFSKSMSKSNMHYAKMMMASNALRFGDYSGGLELIRPIINEIESDTNQSRLVLNTCYSIENLIMMEMLNEKDSISQSEKIQYLSNYRVKFDKLLTYYKSISNNNAVTIQYNNLAKLYKDLNLNNDTACYYYNMAREFAEDRFVKLNVTYNQIRFCKSLTNHNKMLLCKQTIDEIQSFPINKNYIKLLTLFSEYLDKENKYEESKYWANKSDSLNILYLNQLNKENQKVLGIVNQLNESENKITELEDENIENSKEFKLKMWLLGFFLILIAILSLVYIRKIVLAKKEKVNELKIKEKEVEYQLGKLSNYFIEKQKHNEYLEQIIHSINDINVNDISDSNLSKEMKSLKLDVLNQIAINKKRGLSSSNNTDELYFVNKLREEFPNVTEGDISLCKMLRINLSHKEIAEKLNVQPSSIDVKVYRLRKKLNFESASDFKQTILKL